MADTPISGEDPFPMSKPRTLGELKASGWRPTSVKDELRRNLIRKLKNKEPLFPGILGYDDTVIPQIQNAVLAKHDMLFLGLRGQAKTRMLRSLVTLLDEHLPVIAGSEVNDDPTAPLSAYAKRLVAERGDETPIDWVRPEQRFHEKLATPDVTIADLLGEVDMVKHAEGRYLSSEDVMHFGLIPRTNRGIFAINELPDLAPKIQVGLFNVLEERDVQIRGFGVRLNLDVCLVFSANPEDYTNRGRIVTPLKDRIGSVIRTHYPLRREDGMRVTAENAWTDRDAGVRVTVPAFMAEVVEDTVREARKSPHINQRSGVSVRAGIAMYEVMVSNAERRGLSQGLAEAVPRISDLGHLPAAGRGKIELMMADDDVTEDKILGSLVGEAVKGVFNQHFEAGDFNAFTAEVKGQVQIEVGDGIPAERYVELLDRHKVLRREANKLMEKLRAEHGVADPSTPEWQASIAELILEGLYVHNKLSKYAFRGRTMYKK
jgi:magnesium chelatase subunit I